MTTLRRYFGSVFAVQMGLRLFALPAAMVTTLILSKTLGPAQFGSYSYVLAWSSVLVVVATMGFDGFLIREISVSCARRDWGLLRGLVSGPARVTGIVSLAICAVGCAAPYWLPLVNGNPDLAMQVLLGFLLAPVSAMRQIYRSTMQGLHRPLLGFVPELLVQPLAMLLLTVVTAIASQGHLTSLHAVLFQVLSGTLALVVGYRLMRNSLPREIASAPQRTEYRNWIRGALPFLLSQLIFLANEKLSVLTLGMTADFREVGAYALASSLVMLMALPLFTMNTVISGRIAHLHTVGDRAGLQRQLTSAVTICVLLAAPIALVEIAFAERLLGFFREDFAIGAAALRILAVGQCINTASGSVGVVLLMSGHSRDILTATALSTAIGLTCCVLLIPQFGTVGAALAQSVGVIAFNLLLVVRVRQRLQMDTTILATLRNRET